jgi:hypothetical protein
VGNNFGPDVGVGILVDPRNFGKPVIIKNNFNIPGVAIRVIGGNIKEGGLISRNIFPGDSVIEIPCDNKMTIEQNIIRGRIKFSDSGNCVGSMVIGANFWQSGSVKDILNERFINKATDFEIKLPVVLKNPPFGVGSNN